MNPLRPIVLLPIAFLAGCISNTPKNPAATQPVTNVDPALATPQYWLNQPATAEVRASDFNRLFDASEQVAHDYFFPIDRRDYRSHLLVTEPVVSKQWFELWRKDSGTAADVRENSIAPIRRTIHFQFTETPDGSWAVTPKVLVERFSRVDPKYRETLEEEPPTYWYATRRDNVLEEKLAASIRQRLGA